MARSVTHPATPKASPPHLRLLTQAIATYPRKRLRQTPNATTGVQAQMAKIAMAAIPIKSPPNIAHLSHGISRRSGASNSSESIVTSDM